MDYPPVKKGIWHISPYTAPAPFQTTLINPGFDQAATQVVKDETNTTNPWAETAWDSSANVETVFKNAPDILDSGWHYFNLKGGNATTSYVYDDENDYHTFKKTDGAGVILTYSCKVEDLMGTGYNKNINPLPLFLFL